ncbi:MAG: hypothetical protein HOK20_05040 [Alphaproteobacteria bacterium]|nr:hypothetical protein [Alphaproteobacteria bacterium]MBT5540940.1 hypothetical protein [Alphaproteobacteria bacterium]
MDPAMPTHVKDGSRAHKKKVDPAMPTHSKPLRLKTPVRLEFLGSGKTAVGRMLERTP